MALGMTPAGRGAATRSFLGTRGCLAPHTVYFKPRWLRRMRCSTCTSAVPLSGEGCAVAHTHQGGLEQNMAKTAPPPGGWEGAQRSRNRHRRLDQMPLHPKPSCTHTNRPRTVLAAKTLSWHMRRIQDGSDENCPSICRSLSAGGGGQGFPAAREQRPRVSWRTSRWRGPRRSRRGGDPHARAGAAARQQKRGQDGSLKSTSRRVPLSLNFRWALSLFRRKAARLLVAPQGSRQRSPIARSAEIRPAYGRLQPSRSRGRCPSSHVASRIPWPHY